MSTIVDVRGLKVNSCLLVNLTLVRTDDLDYRHLIVQ